MNGVDSMRGEMSRGQGHFLSNLVFSLVFKFKVLAQFSGSWPSPFPLVVHLRPSGRVRKVKHCKKINDKASGRLILCYGSLRHHSGTGFQV